MFPSMNSVFGILFGLTKILFFNIVEEEQIVIHFGLVS